MSFSFLIKSVLLVKTIINNQTKNEIKPNTTTPITKIQKILKIIQSSSNKHFQIQITKVT